MHTSVTRSFCLAAVAIAFAGVQGAQAAPQFGASVTPTKANGDFISGSGIPSDNFAIDQHVEGLLVALKPRNRLTGQPDAFVGNRYFVQPGTVAGGAPAWNFDFQFSPAAHGTLADGHEMELKVDFDPTVGIADFATIRMPVYTSQTFDPNDPSTWAWSNVFGDGFFTNPGSGAWSDDSIDFVYSQSWHLGFNFWTQPPFNMSYDPDAAGEYELVLTAFDGNGNQMAGINAFAIVVPEPASLSLVALGGLTLLRRRR